MKKLYAVNTEQGLIWRSHDWQNMSINHGGRYSISVYRRIRGSRFKIEWHSYPGVHRYLHLTISSPTHHRWWATSLYIGLGTRKG